jgi:mRNA interferase RelE/StbE
MASRFLDDSAGMTALVAAIDALADDPHPPEGFHRGGYHRLRVGQYRVVYAVDGAVITIERVDRVS